MTNTGVDVTKVEVKQLKSAAAEISKGSVRGSGWGYIVWVLLVDKAQWSLILDSKGRADSFTFAVVGLIALLWTAVLRAGERKWPWMSVLLLSKGPPSYEPDQPEQEPADPPPPAPAVDVHVGGDVNIGQPINPVDPAAVGGAIDAEAWRTGYGAVPHDPTMVMPPTFATDSYQIPLMMAPHEYLSEVAQFAHANTPGVEMVDEDVEDAHARTAPHGTNSDADKIGPTF